MKKFIYLAAIIGIVTLTMYCRGCKPTPDPSELKEKQANQTIQALKGRVARLTLDSLSIRKRMKESADSFKLAINAKKVVYREARSKAAKTDYRKASSPTLDSVVAVLYPEPKPVDSIKWEVGIGKAGALVTDAARSYYQDTALTILEEIVTIQVAEKDSLTQNYEKLLKGAGEKSKLYFEETQVERELKEHFKAEASKYKKQRNRILSVIGGAVISAAGGAYAYNQIR